MEVLRNDLGEVTEWKVRWWSTTDGPHKGTELATFHYLRGANYVEVISADAEVLVASTDKLVGGNKKLPAATIKEAKRVLSTALIAEVNGEVLCACCKVDDPAQVLVPCGCCGQVYHEDCAPDYTNDSPELSDLPDWWCPACRVAAEGGVEGL